MSSILEVAAQFRADLAAIERNAVAQLVAAYGLILADLQAELRGLVLELRAQGQPITQTQLRRNERLRALVAQTQAEIARLAAQMETLLPMWQFQTATLGAEAAQQLMLAGIGTAPVTVTFNTLPSGAIAQLTGTLANGSPLKALLDELGPEAAATVRRNLLRGLGLGLNPRTVARLMREALGRSLTRALTIARTEMLRAYREASRATYQENSDVVAGWVWVAKLDRRTCFPAGVLVSGPEPVAGSSRYYSGELVVLTIANGEQLSVTPNHPILTQNGWVPAGFLKQGDYVVCGPSGERAAAFINKHNYHSPAAIEQVVESFPMVSAEMPTAAPDFHGDGAGSDVHVVRANRLLGDASDASALQHVFEDDFMLGHVNTLPLSSDILPSLGFPYSEFERVDAITVPVAEDGPSFLQRNSGGLQFKGFLETAALDTSETQRRSDSVTAYAEQFRDPVFGHSLGVQSGNLMVRQEHLGVGHSCDLVPADLPCLSTITEQATGLEFGSEPLGADAESRSDALRSLASDICLNRVLKVDRRRFSGHVYNLQTVPHWYIANSVIVANCAFCWAQHGSFHQLNAPMATHPQCRCAPVPRTKTWAELGFPGIPEAVPQIPRGADVFARLPVDTQRFILGPAKFRAYQAGDMALEDVIGLRVDPKWGPVGWERSLRDIMGEQADEWLGAAD